MSRPFSAAAASILFLALLAGCASPAPEFVVELPAGTPQTLDGRLILILATDGESEPRLQAASGVNASQIFGVDVEGWTGGEPRTIGIGVFGYPVESLPHVPAGEYWAQAVLHKYETFERADGHTVKLPMDRGEGQHWNLAPGNLYSTPRKISFDPSSGARVELTLDQVIPPIEPPAESKYVKHVEIESKLLSDFWGRPMKLGAWVLVPEGFDEDTQARYPLMVFHGHYPSELGGFREEPPDPDLEPDYSERFHVEGYNRIQQQEAYDFYKRWTSPDFPRYLVIEIQHANPYYDDSYAVNSENLGPYGDAINHELIPYIEKEFRGVGEPWGRFLYGGSTGGWEALAVQVLYPDEFNGTFAACPDPIDFRAYTQVNIYEDDNAYYRRGPFATVERPGHRNYLGEVDRMVRDFNHFELVLGTHSRSGDQFDIWEAVYSPVGEDGYPQRIWDKKTGEIDHEVAEYWRENYDLRHIVERDWATLGPRLEGKLHIYVGDMDNYYLNNAVYLMEDFLESTTNPYYGGEVDYGDRAEHCWNGDQENGNHISRLRYNTMYLPKIRERIRKTAPRGAPLRNWR